MSIKPIKLAHSVRWDNSSHADLKFSRASNCPLSGRWGCRKTL